MSKLRVVGTDEGAPEAHPEAPLIAAAKRAAANEGVRGVIIYTDAEGDLSYDAAEVSLAEILGMMQIAREMIMRETLPE